MRSVTCSSTLASKATFNSSRIRVKNPDFTLMFSIWVVSGGLHLGHTNVASSNALVGVENESKAPPTKADSALTAPFQGAPTGTNACTCVAPHESSCSCTQVK